MQKEKTEICDCRITNIAKKVPGTNSYLCNHTSVLGACPNIEKHWNKNNPNHPNNILKGSGIDVFLDCLNESCRHPNSRRPHTFSKTGTFKCEKCKISYQLRDKEKICDCLERGLATITKGKGYICDHNNLLVGCPNIIEVWSDENPLQPNKISRSGTKEVKIHCKKCGDKTTKKPINLSSAGKYECDECYLLENSLLTACPNIILFWSKKNKDLPNRITRGSNIVINLQCNICGATDDIPAYYAAKCGHYNCSNCYLLKDNVALLYPKLLKQVNDRTDLSKFTHGSTYNVEWKCDECGYIWETGISNRIKHGRVRDCRKCLNLIAITYEVFLTRMKVKYQDKIIFPLTHDKFTLSDSKIEAICEIHGRIYKTASLYMKCGCRYCTPNRSKLCLEIEKWLNLYNIKFTREKNFDGLIDIKALHYDYYIESINGRKYVIEGDGNQHFRLALWDKTGDPILHRMRRDVIKDQFAIDNNISVIRIPYNMIKHVATILRNFIMKCDELGHFICTYKHYFERLTIKSNVRVLIVPSPKLDVVMPVNINIINNNNIDLDELNEESDDEDEDD